MAAGNTLLGAITATFLADTGPGSLAVLVPAGLWFGELPKKVQFPAAPAGVVTLKHDGESPHWTTERPYYEFGAVHFWCLAGGLANAEALALRVEAVFDEDPYTGAMIGVNGATVDKFRRSNYVAEKQDERSADDQPVYKVTVTYESQVTKVLPARP